MGGAREGRINHREITHNVIIDGPEAMELECLDVPVGHRVHLEVRLVPHHVVHKQDVSWGSVRV